MDAPSPHPTSATSPTLFQFCFHAFKRRNPCRDQIRGITRTEKSFRADKELVMMFVPAHSFAGLEFLRELLFRLHRSQRNLKRTRQKYRTGFVGHGERLLFAE